ncbi:outer membrane protein TolC [Dysgonomonas hofstadii]|uniref:Outer membrane protein TolC n=1 Tax=Dysgonomonas hofstadii TaxID=637886 RepID=A0A840CUC0_9BACT|nr:TolC family protein [Dysgonomonas hofstadii]MBB4037788.1 outer membrane protein TolC [Dysgonomonas hofstadii]
MKKVVFIFWIIFFTASVSAQTVLTLDECKQLAVDNYPLIKQYGLIEQAEKYTLQNLSKNYLPQFGLNAQATYQSDVTKLPIDLSALSIPIEIPSLDKDQYKAVVEVSQLIWDGGATSSQQKITRANSEVENQRIEVNLYTVKDQINQLYFGILSIDKQLGIIDLTEQNLKSNKKTVTSMFNNGVAMQSDVDLIDVELLGLEQQRIEQKSLRKATLQMLSLFIHRPLDENTILQNPQDDFILSGDINRPELSLYNSQINMQNKQESSINAKNMPRINLFAQGGYGRPGLNMLEDKFKLFAIGGVKLSWNFGSLYTKKNEKKLIQNNISNIEVQRETFLFNTNVQLTKEQEEVKKAKKLLEKDDDIIRLRNRVKIASESKYKNGVYQMNELIRDINAESMARQSKALHEIQYLMNIYNYKHIQGN